MKKFNLYMRGWLVALGMFSFFGALLCAAKGAFLILLTFSPVGFVLPGSALLWLSAAVLLWAAARASDSPLVPNVGLVEGLRTWAATKA
jgi:hypothetical protein